MILKAEHPARRFERAFIFAADSQDLEEKVKREVEKGTLNREVLEKARVEQLVLGPHANFNFFFSPLNEVEEWGDVDDTLSKIYQVSIEESRMFLANELMSIDERRETILDGLKRLPVDVQKKIEEKTNPSFEVTFHSLISIRESLIKDILKVANSLLLTLRKYASPGIIGAWCLQTLITWDKTSKYNYTPTIKIDFSFGSTSKSPKDYGLYDVSGEYEPYMHIPVTQDLALRHGGGTNVHMGLGGQYSNIKYNRVMSLGDRIALEIVRATKQKMLHMIVT
jgi:5-formaminoimidazole-4-carboxamide-1-(beta)-D-ribofuranosyl 5'-monophosphate synthetase